MASIIREITVNREAAHCWDAVRDFGALHERLAPGFIVDVKMKGTREREVTFFGGAVAREYLVGIDDEYMRLVYSVVESPMGSSHNNASVQVIRNGDAQCRFVWMIDVLPDELAHRTGELMDSGLAVIKKTLEAAGNGS
jgi:Polyketide cyclase / dehydrase and lipid transport